ncbi:MAG: glutamate 5-kinase [Clostridia bacterium]|nr:glutamate 5-kinase [Clostridia bacterium]
MRIVIKIGTSNITYSTGCLNLRHVEKLVKVISDIKNAGHEVILVSSGAIAMGTGKLNLASRPSEIAGKQACAAVGQCELMYTYDRLFGEYNHTVAQILLTAPDLANDERCQKFKATVAKLLDFKALPIINENDTVATEEIEFGDNDTLAAKVAVSVGAELLVLLSDIDGLYTADPRKDASASLIPEVHKLDDEIMALGSGAGSAHGTGGMITKLRAAKIATASGCDMIIMNGDAPEKLYSVTDGEPIGTRFFATDN